MAVQISRDEPLSGDELDPHHVATAFVEQYYLFIEKSPEIVHKFYHDESTVGHPGPDGEMQSVTTLEGINDKIMSSDLKGCSFKPINVDGQASLMGGFLVAVNGYFTGKDNLKRSFCQSFFLAKQTKGYFVLNDILRFVDPPESESLPTSNGTVENASNVLLTSDQEAPEVPAQQPKEENDNGEKVSVGNNEKAADAETVKKSSDDEVSKNASDVGSREHASDVDNGSRKVAAIKDTVAEVSNSSVNGSENVLTLPHVASNEKQDSKKTSYASMVAKEIKVTSPTHNNSHKIVRVAANADQQSISPATPIDPGTIGNSARKELRLSNVAAESNNACADAPAAKSIYIANLPSDITRRGLIDALKVFGRIIPGGVQIRTFEDGFCFGFVEFESAAAASKAVEVHNITVGRNEAYMMYKRSNSRSGNRSGGNGGLRNDNFKGQDTGEIRGNGSHHEDNQADIKIHSQESGRQNGEINQNSRSSSSRGRPYLRNRLMSYERLPAGEAYRRNSQRREERGKNDDGHQKNSSQKLVKSSDP